MVPSRLHPAFLPPLILLATCLALASSQPWKDLNDKFNKNHVDNTTSPATMPDDYCEKMMRARKIYWNLIHTFIHASIPSINNICVEDGIPIQGGLRKSKNFVTITQCLFKPNPKLPTFSYTRTGISKKIVIGCWKRLPVLYVEEALGAVWV
ncbi:hemoglobin subunit alpha-D [Platysternon megacephalum]|uniref:Hemoglobin subunit alpha-D n=1 Tax=Platysternon megacephalum TaxID=55544 RepID=A0A4D9DQM3_9SAUR|nr:hemoglobin subunit alpha-D [Platysternon megacephalum]